MQDAELIKKLESTYVINVKYTEKTNGHPDRELVAGVQLVIDYSVGRYDIFPPGKDRRAGFAFMGTSFKNSAMWSATAQAIKDAVEFAEAEIEKIKEAK